jgi:hypothetical protein
VINPPVPYPLSAEAGRLSSRWILLVNDKADDSAGEKNHPDDSPNDPTLLGRPGGRVEVHYQGVPVASAPVASTVACEVPVRFVAVRGRKGAPFPAQAPLERILDERLRQANTVWEPFGLSFTRASVEIVDPPEHLLAIRGRASGVDDRGKEGRAGAVIDGKDLFVPTRWQHEKGWMYPAVTARALIRLLESAWQVELSEKLLTGEPESVILRVNRKDGTPARLASLAAGGDLTQRVAPLAADFTGRCEVAAHPQKLTFQEIGLVLGCRRESHPELRILIVEGLRSGPDAPAFKTYAEGIAPAPLARTAILSWKIMDGSGRYPYAAARALGELLLADTARSKKSPSLFAEPLAETPAADANKRVGAVTGAEALRGALQLISEKDD